MLQILLNSSRDGVSHYDEVVLLFVLLVAMKSEEENGVREDEETREGWVGLFMRGRKEEERKV